MQLDQGKEVVAPPVQAAIATEAAAYGCLVGTHDQGIALEVYFDNFFDTDNSETLDELPKFFHGRMDALEWKTHL